MNLRLSAASVVAIPVVAALEAAVAQVAAASEVADKYALNQRSLAEG